MREGAERFSWVACFLLAIGLVGCEDLENHFRKERQKRALASIRDVGNALFQEITRNPSRVEELCAGREGPTLLERDQWGLGEQEDPERFEGMSVYLDCPEGTLRIAHPDFESDWVNGFFEDRAPKIESNAVEAPG